MWLAAAAMQRVATAAILAGKPLNRGQRHRMVKEAGEDFATGCRKTILADVVEADEPSHDAGGE
jgi:hypothetical protein